MIKYPLSQYRVYFEFLILVNQTLLRDIFYWVETV